MLLVGSTLMIVYGHLIGVRELWLWSNLFVLLLVGGMMVCLLSVMVLPVLLMACVCVVLLPHRTQHDSGPGATSALSTDAAAPGLPSSAPVTPC